MTDKQWKTLRHFKRSEFQDPASMSYPLLVKLDNARSIAGVPFHITSSTRPAPGTSSHITGEAVDISLPNPHHGYAIIKSLFLAGFLRIIVYDRHVHVDVDLAKSHPLFLSGGKSK